MLVHVFVALLATAHALAPPQEFAAEPRNTTARIGERVILKCRVRNRSGWIQWTKGGFGLGTERKLGDWPRYRMIGYNDENWDLEIHPVTLDDDDSFQCQVGSDSSASVPSPPLRSETAHLTVMVPPENPFIVKGPLLEVIESTEVKLECIAKGGKPAAKINWFDHLGNLVSDATFYTKRMAEDTKLFESHSIISFIPTLEHHNTTYRCEAWNEAGSDLRPASVRLNVKYSPSVTVEPVRPGLIREGDEAAFRCRAQANPPPHEHSYKWFVGDKQAKGQYGFYFKIFNVTRQLHDQQVKCSVENDLGIAQGLKSIQVQYKPSVILHPETISGDRHTQVTLHCAVDSNPPPKYFWTRDDQREPVAHSQNLTVTVSERTTGGYKCHAETLGFDSVETNMAEILLTGIPVITSPSAQAGIVGEDAHIDCNARSVPMADDVVWKYHGVTIDDGANSHYRIIDTPTQNGLRSTLIVRQTLESDFDGPYTCTIVNSHGATSLDIILQSQQPLPLMVILIAVFIAIIFVLTITIVLILWRRNCCQNRKKKPPTTIIMKANNIESMGPAGDTTDLKNDMGSGGSLSNEADSACWEGSDHQDGILRNTNSLLYRHNSDLDDFPPKPDVISTGQHYIPYGSYIRDYNPPSPYTAQKQDATYSTDHSLLNVSDPRYSATYGSPHLRQTGPRGMQYSTFLPPPPLEATPTPPPSSFQPLVSNGGSSMTVSLPPPQTSTPQLAPASSSTPTSSLSNVACLPDEPNGMGAIDCLPDGTPLTQPRQPHVMAHDRTGQYILNNGRTPSGALATHV